MESFINMTDVETSCNDEWTLLEAHLPGRTPEPIGVLLREMRRDRLHVRLKNHWWDILPEEDQGEIWHELANDLERKAREMGAVDVLDWLETTASHSLQISQRQEIQIQILDVETTLDSLFRQHIGQQEVTRKRLQQRSSQRVLMLEKVTGYAPWYSDADANLLLRCILA